MSAAPFYGGGPVRRQGRVADGEDEELEDDTRRLKKRDADAQMRAPVVDEARTRSSTGYA